MLSIGASGAYNQPQMSTEAWRFFWAKTNRAWTHPDRGSDWTHPLWAHLLDVASAAEILSDRLPIPVRERLSTRFGCAWSELRPLLSLIVGFHDAGKAIPSFQYQHVGTRAKLREMGLPLADQYPNSIDRRHHGHASIPIISQWLDDAPVADEARSLLKVFAAAAGFHHGRLSQRKEWQDPIALGSEVWKESQQQLVTAVADAWLGARGDWPDLTNAVSVKRAPLPPEMIALAGWTTLADWVGSIDEFIPLGTRPDADLAGYIPRSMSSVRAAIEHTHLHNPSALRVIGSEDDFKARFPGVFVRPEAQRPHPLQHHAATIKLPPADVPTLAIIEAPTGEGKTEAAFYLAARLQSRRADARGVYVALPTQATSNGLFPRFVEFLEEAHDAQLAQASANVLLVHGASALNLDFEKLLLPLDEDEGVRSSAYAARWFLPTKRSLLAPYGVGTVDQVLLGAITSRHFFLRLYGLAGKTLIFDEVHAYDGYMTALFTRLLEWLRLLGTDVIILSATLPTRTRRRFLEAWKTSDVSDPCAYPAFIVAGARDDTDQAYFDFQGRFPTSQHSDAELSLEDSAPERVVAIVTDAVREGATVGVIVNRVDRAQEIFRILQTRNLEADLYLLHARFPFRERAERERNVIKRFGKEGRSAANRPAVLVATQVAEQSLDLDVDLMLSDLAPIDLLLQRAGRLHRHKLQRPRGYERPKLHVLCPQSTQGGVLPDVSSIGGQFRDDRPDAIYLNLPLYRTYLALQDRGSWSLPRDYRPLIEAVYGDDDERMPDTLEPNDMLLWDASVEAKRALEERESRVADAARIERPERLKELFDNVRAAQRTEYSESDDAPALDLRVQTRLGGPSVDVICLDRRDREFYLQGTDVPLPPGPVLSAEELRSLLECSVSLRRRGLVDALMTCVPLPEDEAAQWIRLAAKNPAIAFHKPLVFDKGRCTVGGTVVEIHPELGIRYNPDPS